MISSIHSVHICGLVQLLILISTNQLSNYQIMEYSTISKTLHLTFKNMTLKKYSRADRRGTELVTEEKFALLFRYGILADLFPDNSAKHL